jgi:hypothetical protein
MSSQSAILAAGIGRTSGRFARHRYLSLCSLDFRGVIAPFNWAKIDEGVLFLGLDREAGRSSLLSTQAHLNAVIRAKWDCRFNSLPAQNHIENPVHVRLQCGNLQFDRADNGWRGQDHLGRSIRKTKG